MRPVEMVPVAVSPHRLYEKNKRWKDAAGKTTKKKLLIFIRALNSFDCGNDQYTYGLPPAIPPGNDNPFVRTWACGSYGIGGRPYAGSGGGR